MYWALTGYVGGFLGAFALHSITLGHFAVELLWLMALFAFLLLLIAVDAEALFLGRWGREIAHRRVAKILTWRFCVAVGAMIGAVAYAMVAALQHFFFSASRGYEVLGITLIVVTAGAALLLVWYLLMRFPRSNHDT
jgi:hypothetical protein